MTDFIAGRDGIRRTVEDLTPHEQAKIAANMFVAMTEDAPKPSKNWLQFRDVWMSTQAPAIVSLSWLLLSMLMAWLGRRVFDPVLHYVTGRRFERGN